MRLEPKQATPKTLSHKKKGRNGERPEAQTGSPGAIPGLPGVTGADRAENVTNWDEEPGGLSAEDGTGRLCSEVGSAGADGACVPASPEYQQSGPAHAPRGYETGRVYNTDLEDIA